MKLVFQDADFSLKHLPILPLRHFISVKPIQNKNHHFMQTASVRQLVPVVNVITYKELQIIYGLSGPGATRRLNLIRRSLGKQMHHVLTVFEFCKAEDISIDDFDLMIKRAYSSL